MTIRVGFYGAGLISRFHTYFLGESGLDYTIAAVHDPDQERAEKFAARHGATVTDEDGLLDLVDAVYVTTWTSEHPRLVAKAAERGLAVFCEKPLGVDLPAVEAMVRSVEDAGVPNQVGLVLRTVGPFLWLRHLVADARAGRVMTVVFRDDQFIPTQGHYKSDWRGDPARAGRGTLLEHSIHDVDILRWIFGEVTSVTGTVREFHGIDRIEDLAVARLDFASGAVASLTSVWHDILERPSLRRVEVFCERLYVFIERDTLGPIRWCFTGEDEQVLEGDDLLAAIAAAGLPTSNSAANFLTAVEQGRAASPDFREAWEAHRLVDAIYRSAADDGVPVALD